MAVDFSLLQPVDIGGQLMQGFQTGRAFVKQIQAENALRAFTKNPDDPEALNALYAFNPQMADHIAQRRMQQMKMQAAQEEMKMRRELGQQAASGDISGAANRATGAGDFEMAKQIMGLAPDQQKKAVDFTKAAGPLAYQMKQIRDPEQRRDFYERAKPILLATGADPAKIDQFDVMDDTALDAYISANRTVDQMIDDGKIDYRQLAPGARFEPFSSATGAYIGSSSSITRPPGASPASGNLQSFRDPGYDALEAPLEQKYGLPPGLISRIRTQGEKSNADQVSSAGARTVYQIIPETRDLFLRKHGIDAYSSPEAAAEVAALHLKESIDRGEDPVRGYIGGPDQGRWGPQTAAYAGRVGEYYPTDGAVGGGDEPNYPGVGALGAPVRVSSKAEVDALPPGTRFIAPNGSVKVKP